MSYGLTRAHEYEDEILLLKARAEKAEAQLKASEEARQNAVLCMMEANRLALEDQARAEKAEAERDDAFNHIIHCGMKIKTLKGHLSPLSRRIRELEAANAKLLKERDSWRARYKKMRVTSNHYAEYKFGFKEGLKRKVLMLPDEYYNNYREEL